MQSWHAAPINRRNHASAGDHAQAAAHADLLTALIAEAEERVTELDYAAGRAHRHDRANVAYRFHREAVRVRHEIGELHQMLGRLLRRFPDVEPQVSRPLAGNGPPRSTLTTSDCQQLGSDTLNRINSSREGLRLRVATRAGRLKHS